jgi:hypothetical protein
MKTGCNAVAVDCEVGMCEWESAIYYIIIMYKLLIQYS